MKNQHICNKILSHPYVQRHLCIHRYYINIYIYLFVREVCERGRYFSFLLSTASAREKSK